MRPKRDVLHVLFPTVRARLFRLLFAAPKREHYVRELMLRSNLALHTVQDELRKLGALKLVISRSNGFHRFYRANRDHVLYSSIRRIVGLSTAVAPIEHRMLQRPPASLRKRKPRSKRKHLPPDRPINWGTLEGTTRLTALSRQDRRQRLT